MKLLVTGGGGFLGANTAKFFSKDKKLNVKVESRRNFSTLKKKLIFCSFVKFKWNFKSNSKSKIKKSDIIIHFAGFNSNACEKNILEAVNFNVFETEKLYENAIKAGVEKFIFISTSHVYGEALKKSVNEDKIPIPINNYGLLKLTAENRLVNMYEKSNKKTQLIILRVSNVFGTPVFIDTNCWHLVFLDFARQATMTNKIILKENPKIIRNFLPMCQFLNTLKYIVYKKLKSNYEIINIGSRWCPTIKEVAKKFQERIKLLYFKDLKIISLKKNAKKTHKLFYFSKQKKIKKFDKGIKNINKELDNLLKYCFKAFS
jgi:UDP-glucose 4-epimerase